jgi:hypothetical protein
MSDALHGMHELCELVRAQVRETRNGARGTYEYVWKERKRGKKKYCSFSFGLSLSLRVVVGGEW